MTTTSTTNFKSTTNRNFQGLIRCELLFIRCTQSPTLAGNNDTLHPNCPLKKFQSPTLAGNLKGSVFSWRARKVSIAYIGWQPSQCTVNVYLPVRFNRLHWLATGEIDKVEVLIIPVSIAYIGWQLKLREQRDALKTRFNRLHWLATFLGNI